MRPSRGIALHSSDFGLQSLLRLLMCYGADAYSEIPLVDDRAAPTDFLYGYYATTALSFGLARLAANPGDESFDFLPLAVLLRIDDVMRVDFDSFPVCKHGHELFTA